MFVRKCEVKQCDRRHYGKGLCAKHYQAHRKYGYHRKVVERHVGRRCEVDGCSLPHYGRGFCKAHHRRWWRRGTTDRFAREPRKFKNGGYVAQWVDGRQCFEHRLVMEAVLGRKLRAGESVHHRNAIKHDNRPENLELWVSWQPHGCRVEDLVAFAREVLAVYG